jgi:glycosyltransferase involved in cell wall biosynthesis
VESCSRPTKWGLRWRIRLNEAGQGRVSACQDRFEKMIAYLETGEGAKTLPGANIPRSAPRVSVIIPAFNVAPYINKTLDSVFSQSFDDFEVILVNDGSEDTSELERNITPYRDSIVYIKQENGGVSAARNIAIEIAKGDLLAFLDGDDEWLPGYLEEQVKFIDERGLDMAYCDAFLLQAPPGVGATYMDISPSDGPVTPVSLILATCNVITSGTIVLKKSLREVGLFDVRMRSHQDFDLWFRLAKHGARIDFQKKPLVKYRFRVDGISGDNVKRARRNVSAFEWLARKYDLSKVEHEAVTDQLAEARAFLNLEIAKSLIVSREYDRARSYVKVANNFFNSTKLRAITVALRISPWAVRTLFVLCRSEEVTYLERSEA